MMLIHSGELCVVYKLNSLYIFKVQWNAHLQVTMNWPLKSITFQSPPPPPPFSRDQTRAEQTGVQTNRVNVCRSIYIPVKFRMLYTNWILPFNNQQKPTRRSGVFFTDFFVHSGWVAGLPLLVFFSLYTSNIHSHSFPNTLHSMRPCFFHLPPLDNPLTGLHLNNPMTARHIEK